jgi:hypothetical protein
MSIIWNLASNLNILAIIVLYLSNILANLTTMILSIGAGRDTGIDGVAIIVNGNIILEPDEIDFLEQKNGYLNVSFSFIQSKTSDSFSGAQILTFLVGIRNFFL